ncbi:protein of unknown function [Thermosyntropha lipolytica DSM 11003]|uniref:DUF4330 domain-containing protein n=1 Tax=Thermosyntropha lipolytica DSM 11003 TaxID=1123382 RepID=A0A1M5JQU3_9FIRM|nr:DUF4330 domain-containing protein [Thermosyntropha lipolytica]SHG42921.1 protein of unknown function [Thermosyntropha lipolytica DSM 11003]
MIIDDKGRLFGLINVIDLIILLIIALLIVGYIYRGRATPVSSEPQTVRLKVVCPAVYPGVENNLKTGDRLIAAGAVTSAEIKEIEVKPAAWVTTNAQGQMVLTTNPFRKDIHLTIEGTSTQAGPAGITLAGQSVRAGKEDFVVKTQLVELKATIVSVEIVK